MGFMSNLFDKPSSNTDGARYSNLQNSSNIPNQSFKQRNSLPERQAAVASIRAKFPNKVPVIVERFKKVSFLKLVCRNSKLYNLQEKSLPVIDKVKFLVPRELTVGQLATIVRNRLSLNQLDSFFLFNKSGTMVTMSMTVSDLYSESMDSDGFLYIEYASQETFGGMAAVYRRQ